MSDDVQPLAVLAENTTPHLKVLVRRNLALETTSYRAQDDAHGAIDGLIGLWVQHKLRLGVVGESHVRSAAEVCDEMGSGNIEVGKVCRIGFV